MDQSEDEIVGNAAAAAYVGMSVDAWRPMVSSGQAPESDRREIRGGHALPVWNRATLDHFKANRPGQGARTDLARES